MSRLASVFLGTAGFLTVTVAAVYLLAAPSFLRHQTTPKASDGGQFQSIETSERPTTTGPREGELAPNFSAPRFGGGTLRLSDLGGKGVVMNFFAS